MLIWGVVVVNVAVAVAIVIDLARADVGARLCTGGDGGELDISESHGLGTLGLSDSDSPNIVVCAYFGGEVVDVVLQK